MTYETGIVVCQTILDLLFTAAVFAAPYLGWDLCDLIRG